MGEIINLVEILEQKEKQKKLQEEMEKEELRANLQWVLDKLHEKNIPYESEDEDEYSYSGISDEWFNDETTKVKRGWFSRLFRRNEDD